jgi:hypothetical protein
MVYNSYIILLSYYIMAGAFGESDSENSNLPSLIPDEYLIDKALLNGGQYHALIMKQWLMCEHLKAAREYVAGANVMYINALPDFEGYISDLNPNTHVSTQILNGDNLSQPNSAIVVPAFAYSNERNGIFLGHDGTRVTETAPIDLLLKTELKKFITDHNGIHIVIDLSLPKSDILPIVSTNNQGKWWQEVYEFGESMRTDRYHELMVNILGMCGKDTTVLSFEDHDWQSY